MQQDAVQTPRVSFGLPVYNGEQHVERAIRSVLAQSFEDLELVVSDNGSTDRTPEICRDIASGDRRLRYCPNEQNIGLLPNYNRLVGLARGELFRWIGVDDWVELEYAEAAVAALDTHPQAIAASTFQAHWDDRGGSLYREYHGPRVDSSAPHRRFARMLRLIQSSYLRFDPIYSLFRREALAGTALHRMTMGADQVLAAELSLVGPWTHVPRCLSHRARVEEEADVIARKTLPPDQDAFDLTPAYRREVFRQVIREAGLDRYQRAHCEAAAHRYYLRQTLRERKRRARRRFRAARRRVLGRLAEATDR